MKRRRSLSNVKEAFRKHKRVNKLGQSSRICFGFNFRPLSAHLLGFYRPRARTSGSISLFGPTRNDISGSEWWIRCVRCATGEGDGWELRLADVMRGLKSSRASALVRSRLDVSESTDYIGYHSESNPPTRKWNLERNLSNGPYLKSENCK